MLQIFAIISFSLVQSSFYKFRVYFRNLCCTTTSQISSLYRSEKVNCEKSGTQLRINISWRHKRRCSSETLHFTQCPNFSTVSQTYNSSLLYFSRMTLKLDCTFRWQLTRAFEQLTSPESWKLFSRKYKVTKHLSSNFNPSYLPLNSVASIECTDSSFLTGKKT